MLPHGKDEDVAQDVACSKSDLWMYTVCHNSTWCVTQVIFRYLRLLSYNSETHNIHNGVLLVCTQAP